MAPVATPTPADLDRQAAKLRDQAAGLNRRKAEKLERDEADYGERMDAAQRTAASARASADSATRQADELQDKAQEMMNLAKKFEQDALKDATEEGPSGDFGADNFRAQAKSLRAAATGMTGRAERAQQEAQRQIDIAEHADREASQIRRAHFDRMGANDAMRLTGASLEDKARELELAAKDLRAAEDRFDQADQAKLRESAQRHLAEADRIKPDYSRIDPQDIVAAGIPMTEVPGAELMDPYAPDPVSPRPVDLHDTDLMDPNAVDPVVPVDPASPPAPARSGEVHDDDLMDPYADPVLGPGASGPDDTGLTDPGAPSGADPLDQARADLAGDADPYGEVPDAGDFGLPTVDAPPAPASVAVAEASFGQDSYMDQPDVGATSSLEGEAYAEAPDDVANEYSA